MITFQNNDGRLGENISFIYGIMRFAKINKIDFSNVCFDLNYVSKNLIKNEKPQAVFKDNIEMFYNIKDMFKNGLDLKSFRIIDLHGKYDLAQMYDFYKYMNLDKRCNIVFKDYWSLTEYFVYNDLNFDYMLLNKICRPIDIVERLLKKFKNQFDVSKSIAIHVRRCDFEALEDINLLTDDSKLNYKKYFNYKNLYNSDTINMVVDSVDSKIYDTIVIFSDDINWCIQNINYKTNVVYIKDQKPYEDLILMSLCKSVIKNKGSMFSTVAKTLSMYNEKIYS